mmetsp:Transcript_15437/g.31338  ORF Transcript_15437/g.31338 Transcript_15437/m.31338 type:complete len:253 (-) Transcript_15437:81-839(-)
MACPPACSRSRRAVSCTQSLYHSLIPSPVSFPPLLSQTRTFAGGPRSTAWSYSEIFGGPQRMDTNVWQVQIPKTPHNAWPRSINYRRYPALVQRLGSGYFFRQHESQLRFLQMRNVKGMEDTAFVGASDPRAASTRTIENCQADYTTGHAVQIILQGRGVRAYFDPEWPHLYVRMGVGVKPIDASRLALKYPGVCRVYLNQTGTVMVVHGFDKEKVGKMARNLLWKFYTNHYTMKGAYVWNAPVKQKQWRKK